MLELRDVHAGYGSVKVLHGVSLQVDAASVVSLVGSNGAGKSTTLGTIAGTVRPNSGSVMFEGVELSVGGPTSARHSVSVRCPRDGGSSAR